MLEQVLDYIHNYFEKERMLGTYTVSSGTLRIDSLQDGQYFRICGSVFNDGVYQYPAYSLIDEQFTGEVWALAVPPSVVKLTDEISDWVTRNADVLDSPYQSESFGGYSYSKATGTNGTLSWQSQFASRLNRWRKICPY